MNTSATRNVTKSARLRVKLAGGAAGLAIAGVILAACSATSAGAVKAPTSAGAGQYRQAVSAAPATRNVSDSDQLRAEHRFVLAAKAKVSGTAGDYDETLRKEHLGR